MKKAISILLSLLLLMGCFATAEELMEEVQLPEMLEDQGNVIVGTVTPMEGNFFTDMWGNNTSDIDVRALLHDYQTIAWMRNGDYAPNEAVAREVTATEDSEGNKTYVFTLQEDLMYNNGQQITAKDYVFSVLLLAAPEMAAIGGIGTMPTQFLGFEAYSSGASEVFAGIRLLDTYQFSLTIAAEHLPYFYELILTNVTPYPMSVIAPGSDIGDDGEGAYIYTATAPAGEEAYQDFSAELLQETILNPETGYLYNPQVTSGAYSLVSFDKAAGVAEFVLNPNFKGNYEGQKPVIETVTFTAVNTDDTLVALVTGQVDILHKISQGNAVDALMQATATGEYEFLNYIRTGLAFACFACEQGPTQFEAVRQAIALCLDQEQYVYDFAQGYAMGVYGYYGLGQWMAQLNILALEELNLYSVDVEAAEALLEQDGWTLNAQGSAYVKGTDSLRYKQVGEELMPLQIRYAKSTGVYASQLLEEMLAPNMAEIGMELVSTELSFSDVLAQYYRQSPREYEMMHLASNFSHIFDPYYAYHTDDLYQGVWNTTGLRDEELMELAAILRSTEGTEIDLYSERWLDFQRVWAEKLPAMPLYSNVYFDFHRADLVEYYSNQYWSWPSALLYAYYGVPIVEEYLEDEFSFDDADFGDDFEDEDWDEDEEDEDAAPAGNP